MKLKSLLMCRNPQSLRLLETVLEKFEIQQDFCSSAEEAIELVTRGNYSAIALDFDMPGAAQAAKFAHMAPPHRRPVVFGMIGASTEIEATLYAGVNFPLYKPLDAGQVTHSIRAAYGFMRHDLRVAPRYMVDTVVYLLFGKKLAIPTRMMNLSESGFCVQAAEPLPAFERVEVHFLLPGTSRAIEGTAELVWTDNSGKAGMFFSEMPVSEQRFLRKWLASRMSRNHVERATRSSGAAKPHPAAVLV
jgi:CheY-like chemotaxis protein